MKRAMGRFRGARGKSVMTFVEFLEVLQKRHDEGLPVEGDLRQEPGSHDAVELFVGTYHGNGCW